jgi:hypothetical protein
MPADLVLKYLHSPNIVLRVQYDFHNQRYSMQAISNALKDQTYSGMYNTVRLHGTTLHKETL